MIAIFTVLGLILFSGGAYAIFDGWPYLVLERGFTQVIIGSIASTAGLILLSLAWVLREFRAVRRALQEDAEARIALAPAASAPAGDAFESPRPGPLSPALVPAAVGAAAAGAVAEALFAPSREDDPAAPQPAPAADRDLFGDLVRRLRDHQPETEEKPGEASAPETPPLPDMFKGGSAEPHDHHEEPPIEVATESHEPAEIVAAKVQPIGEDEALAHADDLAHAEPRKHAEPRALAEDLTLAEDLHEAGEPEQAEAEEQVEETVSEPEEHKEYEERQEVAAEAAAAPPEERIVPAPAASDDLDEFSALRASLTGHLRQTAPESKRIEPSLEPEADPFAEAEAWMGRAAPRKEPWFEPLPPANEPQATEPESPPWPPRTGPSPFAEPPAAVAAEPEQTPVAEESAQSPQVEEPVPPTAVEAEAKSETESQESPAAAPEPAASEEGVVGAYQVGDAHFTIYADGSIRARTPDGEYSFSSMDELKVYLASEKSRLGV